LAHPILLGDCAISKPQKRITGNGDLAHSSPRRRAHSSRQNSTTAGLALASPETKECLGGRFGPYARCAIEPYCRPWQQRETRTTGICPAISGATPYSPCCVPPVGGFVSFEPSSKLKAPSSKIMAEAAVSYMRRCRGIGLYFRGFHGDHCRDGSRGAGEEPGFSSLVHSVCGQRGGRVRSD
jgi:hypothetical protein